MQTQYQLLYRYVNETTNTAITNEFDYVETKEFYNPDHKLYFTTNQLKDIAKYDRTKKTRKTDLQFWFDNKENIDTQNPEDGLYTGELAEEYVSSIQKEAESERESIILSEMANANKSNNFYIYTGTTKEYHEKYMPESIGYLVSNLDGVPERQMPSGPNDFSKHFVMMGGSKPGIDGAFLICKSEYINAYKHDYEETNDKKEQMVLSGERFANNLFFDWYNPQDDSYMPRYGETSAELKSVTTQEINSVLSSNGYRIVNLSGEDYLITEAVEYWCNVTYQVTNSQQVSDANVQYTYTGKYDGTVHESMIEGRNNPGIGGKRVTFGTIFFNCGTVIPKEITFASEDGATLANASDIMTTSPSSTIGDDVLDAFNQFAPSLKDVKTGTVSYLNNQRPTENDNRSHSVSGPALHSHLLWYKGWKISDLEAANMGNFIASLKVEQKNLTRYSIPAHYEPSGSAPYLIKDNYKKITLSPWILHSIHNSLDSGLEKAKELVSMIGINNVKLIKTVPFDQFVKIK